MSARISDKRRKKQKKTKNKLKGYGGARDELERVPQRSFRENTLARCRRHSSGKIGKEANTKKEKKKKGRYRLLDHDVHFHRNYSTSFDKSNKALKLSRNAFYVSVFCRYRRCPLLVASLVRSAHFPSSRL